MNGNPPTPAHAASTPHRTIAVALSGASYTVHVGEGLLPRLVELGLGALTRRPGRAFLCFDANVPGHFIQEAREALTGAGLTVAAEGFHGGEAAKSLATVERLAQRMAHARASGFRMIVLPRNGAAALDLLKSGRVHVAGLHRATSKHPFRNAEAARSLLGTGFRLVRAAHWVEGLALPASTRTRSVRGAVAQARTWALREPGAAARDSLEELREGRPAAGRVVRSHSGVADAVRAGWAQAGVCVQIAAKEAGLRFLPIRSEALDLCFLERDALDPRVQALVGLLRGREYRQTISELPGYDASETGALVHHEKAASPA